MLIFIHFSSKSPEPKKKGKQARVWGYPGGTTVPSAKNLDFSEPNENGTVDVSTEELTTEESVSKINVFWLKKWSKHAFSSFCLAGLLNFQTKKSVVGFSYLVIEVGTFAI